MAGKPHTQPTHPDYTPSVFPSVYRRSRGKSDASRFNRHLKRMQQAKLRQWEGERSEEQEGEDLQEEQESLRCTIDEDMDEDIVKKDKREDDSVEEEDIGEEEEDKDEEEEEKDEKEEDMDEEEEDKDEEEEEDELIGGEEVLRSDEENYINDEEDIELTMIDACSQTEDEPALVQENRPPQRKIEDRKFGFRTIEGNDDRTKFYTGLPSWAVFLHLFLFLAAPASSCKLSLEDEFFIALLRLKLGLLLEDIALRFDVSLSVVSRVFQKWLDLMYVRLSFMIAWPERDVCKRNMPVAFKETYPNCRCIIDCTEIFIETPKNYIARVKTFSNYKKHNTVKFLIGITPFGTVSFLSDCWGGRVSDKNLTQSSDFFNQIEHGDTILADRGFSIAEDLGVFGANLEIPAYTRGKTQLSQREVELSKQLSRVRIHVERVIGLVKNKYLILKGPLPICLLKHKGDTTVANIDKIVTVCSALTNLSATIV